jgi:opacity protein-like surface antigen
MNLRNEWIRAGLGTCLALVLASLAARQARADDYVTAPDWGRGAFSIGGRATYFWEDGQGFNNGNWFGGGQLRFYGQYLGLELSSDYRRIDDAGTKFDAFPLHGDVLFYLFPGRISPYAIGGVNWIVTGDTGGAADAEDRFGVEAGGGLQLMVDQWWSINAEYRHVWFTDGDGTTAVGGDGNYIMAGINFHFGAGVPVERRADNGDRVIIRE